MSVPQKATKIIYATKFNGEPKLSDFKFVTEELPELKDNEVLCEAIYLSVDPYMRAYIEKYNVGITMIGGQIANNTAYFGFLELCQPEYGDTVCISGAAGAVGSLVGQIAKIKGCFVVGITGTDEKCEWLKKELGFDAVINYKKENVRDALLAAAPIGVDCYFDNVGGEMSSIVISQMKRSGRIAICGSSSTYNMKVSEWPKEFLCEAEYLSVDPYMKAYMERYPLGITMVAGQIAKVLASKNKEYPKDSFIYGHFGWRTHTIFNANNQTDPIHTIKPYVLPNFGNLPVSLGLGYLGMPGNTAYFGFLEICKPKSGETVVVTGAAGAVGSIVGQIAKIKGCTVIGFTGSDDKCEWLTNELGFDHVINYRTTENITKALRDVAPQGIDCYFDNVGGELSSIVIQQMNKFGRVSVCGSISTYGLDEKNTPKTTILQPTILFQELKIEGFLVYRWLDRWMEGITQIKEWIDEGKIKYHETITNGFDQAPNALIDMLRGENKGKAVVKVHV